MACYPGQPALRLEDQGDPLSDSEQDYKDFSAGFNSHSTQVIVKWLELNYHYEEGVCLPRSTIYEHYIDFCERENIQPVINAASFGKLIRQQFSSLTTRRLGTRGKSKYHYFGLGIRPTSLYYNEEYFKRQKEGVSRKEPDKKVHPVYPKENPSSVLPPFPKISQLKLLQEVPKDTLTTFMVMYRTHCQRILDSVSRANFNEVEDFLLHFWQAMPPHLLPVMASGVIVDLVALCDTILYSIVSSVLIISPVQSFPESLLQEVLKFCSQLGRWLDTATTGLPESLRHIKQQTATTFVKTLKRQIAIMELAKATRKALQREDQLAQLFRDWEGLDMHAVLAHVLFAIQPLGIPPSSLHIIPELLRQFVGLLEDKTSVEDLVEWGQSVLQNTVKCREGCEERDLVQSSQMFILTWKLFTSKISREITLQNAPSFGTFHLIHMLMDDYLLHLLECELEKQQQRDFERKLLILRDEEKEPQSSEVQRQAVARGKTQQPPPSLRPPPRRVGGGGGGGRVQSSSLPQLDTIYPSPGHTTFSPQTAPSTGQQQTQTLESLSSSSAATPISSLHTVTQDTLARGGEGGGGGGGGLGGGGSGSQSLPQSPLLDPHPSSLTSHQIASTPPSASSSLSPSLPLPAPPPSHSSSLLPPPSNLPLGTTPLSTFPVFSQPLPPPPLPSLSLSSSSLPSHPPTGVPNQGMTHFVQGLQALNPHQPPSIPFSNHLAATATTPFGASLTSMAGSLPNPLPILPTLYPYGPYGGMGGVPVVQGCPVSVGVVGGGPVNCGSGPPAGVLHGTFPPHSLMPTYSSYISPNMYPGNQINTTHPSS